MAADDARVSGLTRVMANNMAPRIWLITGPTASGKSPLALALAERLGGEIVNADSMQLYADLRVLTARPSAEEEARAPHHLFGVVDGADGWSTGKWLRACTEVLEGIAARGRDAIVVGGTGLYFKALTEGLAEIPPIPSASRATATSFYRREGEGAVRDRLLKGDPVSEARIAPADKQRLIRALEVLIATGRGLTDWHNDQKPALPEGSWRAAVIEPEREGLYARCDARLGEMVEAGALDEVAALTARGLDENLPVMKAVGVREFSAHLRGEIDLERALTLARQETRHYAKRQLTWLRNQTPDWDRLPATLEDQLAVLT
ncbi:MAG: tRNA ((37)-N6)-dimethylallyltransferase MiaA [Caulobacter sp.]|nr:tRNA ((37)-N6)-dimethylallyltransferase MiaA [Caulobacter sp.]